MAPKQLAALRHFFAGVEPKLPEIVDVMYGRIFQAHPGSEALFKGDLQEQKRRYAHMLQSIVQLTRSSHLWPIRIDKGKATLPVLNELKSRHAKAGVTPEHFEVMKAELLEACREIAPAEFTPAAAEALAFVFDVLARSLTISDSAAAALVRKNQPARGNGDAALHDPGSFFDYEEPGSGNK
ncbi:MAG: globin domain-containing protein [Rhodomicrobium sp.]